MPADHAPPSPTLPRRGVLRAIGRGGSRLLFAAGLAGLVGLSGLAGCGGGEDLSQARVRLVNASQAVDALDLVVDNRRVHTAVAYGESPRYAGVDTDDPELRVARSGSPAALVTLRPSLSAGDRYTVVAYGGDGAVRAVLLDDNAGRPDDDEARVRVLNGAPDAGPLDVYLTASTVALDDAEPLHAGAAAGTPTDFGTVDAATWRLRVTAAGDKDDLRLDIDGIVLAEHRIVTLVVTPGAGGVLVNALLLTQGGDVKALAGAQARVRAVAGVTASGSVGAVVGGVTLMDGVGAPAVGPYRLVPAGPAVAALTVDGAAVAVPSIDLAAGSDHTLLVRGPVSAPEAHWIADDNRLPAVAGRARLRLLNGVADLATPLALTLDFTPVAAGVAPGTASAPALVDATTQGRLEVSAAGLGAPLYSAVEQLLLADRVYTLFVLGPASAPSAVLYRDR